MSNHLPFAYFGTPQVAARTLESLIQAGFVPEVVVTNPDAPKGRGLELTPSPVKELALARGIPVLTPEKLGTDARAALAARGCTYGICVAYGKIFPQELLDAFPQGVINVHYSLLPKYRGATPTEAALLNGDTETGVTIQKMAFELDAGDILAQESLPIAENETVRELRPRLIALGAKLLVETLPKFERGEVVLQEQDGARASRARKFHKEDGRLDLTAPGAENWNKYRAYADTIGTHFFTPSGMRVKITAAHFAAGSFVIDRVIPEGKKEIAYTEFAKANA